MTKQLTLLWAVLVFALQFALLPTAVAQDGTQNDEFIFQILTPSSIQGDYPPNTACGWGPSSFGPDVTEELAGQAVWARTAAGDSLGCSTITTDLTDKFAVIRRGTCAFSLKVYNAQQAGAKAVLILNHYTTATDNACILYNMTGLDSAAAVTIPSIFLPRARGEEISGALDAGLPVNVKFAFPRFYDAAGPYHYATPIAHVDTLVDMGVRYVNRSPDTQTDILIRSEITEPGGNVVAREVNIASLGAGVDTFVYFEPYLPPSVLGEFNVQLTNNKYTAEARDTLRRKFVHTENTFSLDNYVLDPGGVGVSNANFIAGGFQHQEAAIVVTGPTEAQATSITFGISNIDSVFVPNAFPGSTANDIALFLYDGDADDDGFIDLSSGFDDLTQIGFGVYTMTGNEINDELITVPITDIVTGENILLEPRHVYYSSLYYNGLEAGYGRDIRFANTLEEWFYLNFPSKPISVGTADGYSYFDGGWSGATAIQRLNIVASSSVNPGPQTLADAQVAVSPNPATDQVRVDLKLAEISPVVTLTLFDWMGRTAMAQKTGNFQEGQLSMNVGALPSGMYLLWVKTAEGMAVRKVAICH